MSKYRRSTAMSAMGVSRLTSG